MSLGVRDERGAEPGRTRVRGDREGTKERHVAMQFEADEPGRRIRRAGKEEMFQSIVREIGRREARGGEQGLDDCTGGTRTNGRMCGHVQAARVLRAGRDVAQAAAPAQQFSVRNPTSPFIAA